tara:strand:- start:1811 stop:2380 length:570 start_codon:yes stop_codon:yes gene_type:complete
MALGITTRPAACVALCAALTSLPAAGSMDSGELCRRAIARAETAQGIPNGLLLALGHTETGIQGVVWPWSLNIDGRPRRYLDRRSAVAALTDAVARGTRNIDAGCLQLNMRWAGRGMSPQDLLDPDENVRAGAAWLKDLYLKSGGSWTDAVARYHSGRPARGWRYVCRVHAHWTRIRFGEARRGEGCPE